MFQIFEQLPMYMNTKSKPKDDFYKKKYLGTNGESEQSCHHMTTLLNSLQ